MLKEMENKVLRYIICTSHPAVLLSINTLEMKLLYTNSASTDPVEDISNINNESL